MYYSAQTPIKFILSMVESTVLALNAKDGVDIEIKEHKTKRTIQQNSFYWVNCTDIAKFLTEAGLTYGEYELDYTSEIIHEINKKKLGVSTTTKLSKQDFCEYMTKMFAFWIEKTNGFWQPKESPYSYLERTGIL